MNARRRAVLALVCGALATAFAVPPAFAQAIPTTSTFAADADGKGLELTIGGQALSIGVSHGEMTSDPSVSGLGAGILQVGQTVAETSGGDAPASAGVEVDVPLGGLGSLTATLAQGTSASTLQPLGTTNTGSLASASVAVTDLLELAGLKAVSSEAVLGATASTATAAASASGVELTVQLASGLLSGTVGDTVTTVCEAVGAQLGDLLGETVVGDVVELCEERAAGEGLTDVLTVQILSSAVVCQMDRTTGAFSVPRQEAALAKVTILGVQLPAINLGQTIELLDGTPLHIKVSQGVVDVTEEDRGISAVASAASVELLGAPLPEIALVASESSCGVSGEVSEGEQVQPPPALPRTGAPLGVLFAGGGTMIAAGYGLRRFLKRGKAA